MAVSADMHTKVCEIDDLRDWLDVSVISSLLQTSDHVPKQHTKHTVTCSRLNAQIMLQLRMA